MRPTSCAAPISAFSDPARQVHWAGRSVPPAPGRRSRKPAASKPTSSRWRSRLCTAGVQRPTGRHHRLPDAISFCRSPRCPARSSRRWRSSTPLRRSGSRRCRAAHGARHHPVGRHLRELIPYRGSPVRYSRMSDSLPLEWSDVPEGTAELAMLCEDPDAPSGTFLRWLVTGIPANSRNLPESVTPPGATTWVNKFGEQAYGGPQPPVGDDPTGTTVTRWTHRRITRAGCPTLIVTRARRRPGTQGSGPPRR